MRIVDPNFPTPYSLLPTPYSLLPTPFSIVLGLCFGITILNQKCDRYTHHQN
ncbi:hypothetical protein [Moorena bouillonii]|uniref:hypothetical protein n=1 Tax=Moorena bouillonii TaxID=207920 RepID=UPI0013015F07|nr:hypothetical protein [Moorena bouillonii]